MATLNYLYLSYFKVHQVTEKQFSTQFQWKDKLNILNNNHAHERNNVAEQLSEQSSG